MKDKSYNVFFFGEILQFGQFGSKKVKDNTEIILIIINYLWKITIKKWKIVKKAKEFFFLIFKRTKEIYRKNIIFWKLLFNDNYKIGIKNFWNAKYLKLINF